MIMVTKKQLIKKFWKVNIGIAILLFLLFLLTGLLLYLKM